jgi:hypothetical protein
VIKYSIQYFVEVPSNILVEPDDRLDLDHGDDLETTYPQGQDLVIQETILGIIHRMYLDPNRYALMNGGS